MTPTDNDACPVRRLQTPPEIRWLLNERAALAGEASRLDYRSADFARCLARLELLHDRALSRFVESLAAQQQARERVAALDRTMRMLLPEINPAACGEVQAWAGKYGVYGELTRFVLGVRERAGRTSVPFLMLRNAAVAHFRLKLDTRADRQSLRSSLRSSLERLRARGLVERSPPTAANTETAWRFKRTSSIDDLRALVGSFELSAVEAHDERHPHPH